MKIKEIKLKEGSWVIYQVTFIPNWLEKLFGVKEKTKEYFQSSNTWVFGDVHGSYKGLNQVFDKAEPGEVQAV